MPNLFTHPPGGAAGLPLIAPSILSADFARMADDCAQVLAPAGPPRHGAGADLLHVDVMDGHFVGNLTMGPDMVRCLRRALPGAFLDVHVMVTDPEQYLEAFAKAGADHYTFHIEPALDPRSGTGMSPLSGNGAGYDPIALSKKVRASGMSVGLAVNPPTPIEPALPLIPHFDLILIMSVNPGFGGQAFIPSVLDKVRRVKPLLGPHQRLEMDGGLSPENAGRVVAAGCDVIVAGSSVFGKKPDDRAEAVRSLRAR